MKITDDWLIANQTPRGAWKAKQLLAIGVAWPPAQGWKQRVIGREIGIEQQRVFESFAGSRPSFLANSAPLPLHRRSLSFAISACRRS